MQSNLRPVRTELYTKVRNVLSTTNGKVHIGVTVFNEMVSWGDTAISLHILQPPLTGGGVFWKRSDLDSGKKI